MGRKKLAALNFVDRNTISTENIRTKVHVRQFNLGNPNDVRDLEVIYNNTGPNKKYAWMEKPKTNLAPRSSDYMVLCIYKEFLDIPLVSTDLTEKPPEETDFDEFLFSD